MDIQPIESLGAAFDVEKMMGESQQPAQPAMPSKDNISTFNDAMKSDSTSSVSGMDNKGQNGADGNSSAIDSPQLQELLAQLIKLIKEMMAQIGDDKTQGGSTAGPDSGVNPVEGNGSGGSAGNGGGLIPKPTEHIQQLNLGGTDVTVGGDGSASAEEVASTAQSIEQLYQNSPTFKNMIDNSSDPSFEVSVGRRDDNTSWGNTNGSVFMNINNIDPGNNDTFQGLLGHEFAHASIDIGHGAQMEQIENAVAREA